ncbi:MAG: hypothetical protein ACYTFW_03060 [Planctomycetota bacterium]|jgi:hypothetical protein
MKSLKDIKNRVTQFNVNPRSEMRSKVLDEALEIQRSQKQSSASDTYILKIIMKNRITKLATVAAIVLVVALTMTFLDKSVTPAYALEQTIQASSTLRYLHTKYFHGERDDVAKECWFEFDGSGKTKNLRINWSEWFGGGEVVVWNEKQTKIWKPKRNLLTVFNDEIYTSRVYNMMESEDPKLIVGNLYAQEAKGQVKIEIEESNNKAEPIIVTATYRPESPKYGDRKILFVDKSTKLTTRMELYVLKENEYNFYGVIEYYDYNVPIVLELFNLSYEIPKDTHQIDLRIQDTGLVQGEFTDEKIAIEVVRQFIESLIAKDYTKASQLLGGLPQDEVKKAWGKLNITRLVSIGEPIPPPKPSKVFPMMLSVPYAIEVEKGREKITLEKKQNVRQVLGRRERWVIH